jgi:hypothetical protein
MREWDRLPWYEQRLLHEGLRAEQPWIQRAVMLDRADDPLSLRGGLFDDLAFDDDEQPDDLAEFGVNIRRSEAITPLYQPAGG